MSQIDLFGGETPLEELELPAVLAMLAEAERKRDSELTADEAGALIHARNHRHGEDERCRFCAGDGAAALERLRSRLPLDPGSPRRDDPPRLTDRGPGSSGPRARSTDPATSHAAAGSVRGVTALQAAILDELARHGPMTDEQIAQIFVAQIAEGHVSPSGLRTRRAELEHAGKVVDTGELRRLASGRQGIVWGLPSGPDRGYDREPDL